LRLCEAGGSEGAENKAHGFLVYYEANDVSEEPDASKLKQLGFTARTRHFSAHINMHNVPIIANM
jgi:hypothetical protein